MMTLPWDESWSICGISSLDGMRCIVKTCLSVGVLFMGGALDMAGLVGDQGGEGILNGDVSKADL